MAQQIACMFYTNNASTEKPFTAFERLSLTTSSRTKRNTPNRTHSIGKIIFNIRPYKFWMAVKATVAIDSVANTFDIIVIQLLAEFKWFHAVCSVFAHLTNGTNGFVCPTWLAVEVAMPLLTAKAGRSNSVLSWWTTASVRFVENYFQSLPLRHCVECVFRQYLASRNCELCVEPNVAARSRSMLFAAMHRLRRIQVATNRVE